LARRAHLLKEFRAKDEPVILCSAGDFYSTPDVFNEAKSHFVARIMGMLEYDAVGVGEMDLNYGLDKLVDDAEQYKLHVTSANILAKGERKPGKGAAEEFGTVFPPYIVVEKGGVKFGFVGLVSPETRLRGSNDKRNIEAVAEAKTYVMASPKEMADRVIPVVRKKCDVVILLAHMHRQTADALMPTIPPVDFVVLGHESRTAHYQSPQYLSGARMLKATSQGQNLGVVTIEVGSDKKVTEIESVVHLLGEDYTEDVEMNDLVDQFEKENRDTQKALFAKEQLRRSNDAGIKDGTYLGLGACQACHAEAFDVYKKTRHATAYSTLSAQFVHRDSNCVGCHVTGWGEPGGHDGMRYRGAEKDLIDVQCEACHGPGSNHARDGSYKSAAIESCTRCHTENDDPDFDFATDWEKIKH